MVENFKIIARELKRQLKISVFLPKEYNITTKIYPVCYIFDAQLMFHSLDDAYKVFDLPTILENYPKNCILIGLHSPKNPDWRISELCPYYKKDNTDVDPALSKIFADYLVDSLHPILKQRYRIEDTASVLGFQEGAVFALYALYHYPMFSSAGLFSLRLSCCENVWQDLEKHLQEKKQVYIFQGGKENEENDLVYQLYSKISSFNSNNIKLNYENEQQNNYSSWQTNILDFFDFILP